MEYMRNCPICNTELKTTNKYWNAKALNENRSCNKCAKIGRVFSDEHRRKLRENHADISGKLNPFSGKSHTNESIDKMLATRGNHPTWKQNASNTMKRIRNEYWGNDNPMNNVDSVHKIRIKRIEEIRRNHNGQISPNYNVNAIPIIEAKASELGITDIQHAQNGGEYYIKELGYWVDGYSREKNIVIEYYEKFHRNQIKRDSIRETSIKKLLGCEFIIIYE